MAIDGSGNVWVGSRSGNLSELANSGTPVAGSPFTGGGLVYAGILAIDGAGSVWSSNSTANIISHFSSAGVALSGPSG